MNILSIIGVFQSSSGYHLGSLGVLFGFIGVSLGFIGVYWGIIGVRWGSKRRTPLPSFYMHSCLNCSFMGGKNNFTISIAHMNSFKKKIVNKIFCPILRTFTGTYGCSIVNCRSLLINCLQFTVFYLR